MKLKKIPSVESNMGVITLDFTTKLVMPYEDALKLMAALSKAERYKDPYGGPSVITGLEQTQITLTVMSKELYRNTKMANLLGIPSDELTEDNIGEFE